MGRVMAFGAKKYAAWSWSDGKAWSKDYAAVMRHLTYWANGEDVDPESGESHLAHAACDTMFLLVSQLRGLGTDDRKKFAMMRGGPALEVCIGEAQPYSDARVYEKETP